MIMVGFVAGSMTAAAFILLIEKANPTIKSLLIGHYVLTDIIGTMISFSLLPVVGAATLISACTFCLIFTLYLHYQRRNAQWTTISMLVKNLIKK
tara:strand:- start:245 stop:529 length:285 start_codon:yes stop_codon:yes gene_type:complete